MVFVYQCIKQLFSSSAKSSRLSLVEVREMDRALYFISFDMLHGLKFIWKDTGTIIVEDYDSLLYYNASTVYIM